MKLIVASVVTAVVVFLWGFVSWTQLGWHAPVTMHNLPNEAALTAALNGSVQQSGAYFFPGMPEEAADASDAEREAARAAMNAAYAKGPIGFLVFARGGRDQEDPLLFVKGFLLDVLYALVAAWLLCRTCASNPSYVQRVLFVTGLGLFAGISTHLNAWHWMSFPLDYSLVMAADSLIGWLLGGLVMAAMLKPRAAAA